MTKISNLHQALVRNANDDVAIRIFADDGITLTGPITVSNTVEVTNDVGNPLPVNGTVEVTNDAGNPLPVSGNVTAVMSSAGHLGVTTAATGSNWTTFSSQVCKQLTISNDSGVSLEIQQGGSGVGLVVQDGTYYAFYGITNANQLGVRRKDVSNTTVTVTARWES